MFVKTPVGCPGDPQLVFVLTKIPNKISSFADPEDRHGKYKFNTHLLSHDLNSNLPLKIGPPSFRSQVIRPPVNGPVQKLKCLNGTCKLSLQSWLWASGNTARWRIFLLMISDDAGHPMKTASPVNGRFPAGNLIEFTKSSLKSSG